MAVRKPLYIFAILALYIVLQFTWWVYLLYQQGVVIRELEAGRVAPDHRSYSLAMVIGEGAVFLALLLTGLYLAYRAYRKEVDLVRAKDNFLMAVTHELRTPIAGMRLNLQTLERQELSMDQRTQLMARAINDLDRLQSLSDHILVAAKSNSPTGTSETEQIDIVPVIKKACDRLSESSGAKHSIDLRSPTQVMHAIDPAAMTSIIENLVQNAINYSPEGSEIEIDLQANEHILIEVKDKGVGIPKSHRALVFEKFFRGGDEKTRSTKGTGLGLYIVKTLVNRYNGHVDVKANSPSGSIFTVQFG